MRCPAGAWFSTHESLCDAFHLKIRASGQETLRVPYGNATVYCRLVGTLSGGTESCILTFNVASDDPIRAVY